MSIEDALLKSAAAQEKLAEAMTRYAAVMERIADAGVSFVGAPAQLPEGAPVTPAAPQPAAAAAADAPADKPRRGRPPKAKEEQQAPAPAPQNEDVDLGGDEDDADPFADDAAPAPAEKKYTAAEIRDLILKVRDIGGEKANAAQAKEIIKKVGVTSVAEIKESDYAKVAKLCHEALAKAK